MYERILGVRLLFAKALGETETAIVIDTTCGYLLGGVVVMTSLNTSFETHSVRFGIGDLKMEFRWLWYKTVTSPDDFAANKEWECPPEVSETKYLRGPRRWPMMQL